MNLVDIEESAGKTQNLEAHRIVGTSTRHKPNFRSLCRGAVDVLLDRAGFQIMRKRSETSSWMKTLKYRDMIIDHISKPMSESIARLGQKQVAQIGLVRNWVAEYFNMIPKCPVSQFVGGGGWNAGLHLFCLSRAIEPMIIIESGTYKGFSSWIFRQANPRAELHCFDVDLSRLEWRDPTIIYHEYDWFDSPIQIDDPAVVFAYFDDHVSQARRILEASRLSLSTIAFDDNLPTEGIYIGGASATPTVDMILDDRLSDNDLFEWYVDGKYWRYVHKGATVADAREKIKSVVKLPDMEFFNRCNTTVVQLHT